MRKVIFTTMVLMFLSSVGYGADWKYIFTAPTGGEWFYDTQNITHGKDTTFVWTRWILSDKERVKFVNEFPKEFRKTNSRKDISFFIEKKEINCSKNVVKIMSMAAYSSDGELMWSSGAQWPRQFEDVFPDSKGVTLIEAICKKGEGGK